jgi:prephenate dehydrogenase
VPGHPIAGTEKSGAGAAFPELYQGKRTILTPGASTPDWAVQRIQEMWEAAGAKVELMEPARHDAVLAAISHLPHAAAFSLVNAVLELERKASQPILKYAAGGFLDFTRIASSDPTMWRDIFLQNGPEILASLAQYEGQLQELRRLIETKDANGLSQWLAGAKSTRDNLLRR